MGPHELERLEAMLISLRDQVDALSDRVDAQRESYAEQLGRLEALVLRALRPPSFDRATRTSHLVSEPLGGGGPPMLSGPLRPPGAWVGSEKPRR